MADPTKYTPSYDFSDYQATNPKDPLPGVRVDIELADIAQSNSQTIDALADIRRSDGQLRNGIVTKDSLDASALTDFSEIIYEQVEEAEAAAASASEDAASASSSKDAALLAAANALAAEAAITPSRYEQKASANPIFSYADTRFWDGIPPSGWGIEQRNAGAASLARKYAPTLWFGRATSNIAQQEWFLSANYSPIAPHDLLEMNARLAITGTVMDGDFSFVAEFISYTGAVTKVVTPLAGVGTRWITKSVDVRAPDDVVGVRYGLRYNSTLTVGSVFFTDVRGGVKRLPAGLVGGTSGVSPMGSLIEAATNFAIFAKVTPVGPGADRALQDFAFNYRSRVLYLVHPYEVSGADQGVISRAGIDDGLVSTSFNSQNPMPNSSGRGLSIQHNGNGTDRLWISGNDVAAPGKAIRFRYTASGDAASVTEFQMIPAALTSPTGNSCDPSVSFDQRWMVCVFRDTTSLVRCRIWDMRPLAEGAGGDVTNDWLWEWSLSPDQIGDATQPVQGICSDGVYVYVLTGSGDPALPKKLYKYALSDGTVVERIDDLRVGYDEYLVAGSVWEPEGLSIYKAGPSAAPQLAVGMLVGSGGTKARYIYILGSKTPTQYRTDGVSPAQLFHQPRARAAIPGVPLHDGIWDPATNTWTVLQALQASGNVDSVTRYAPGFGQGVPVPVADDAVISFVVPGPNNTALMAINSSLATGTANPKGVAWINADSSPGATLIAPAAMSNVTFTSGVLAGTTGTDGNITISAAADGRVYIENRSGAARTFSVMFLAPT